MDKTYAGRLKAGAILEKLFEQDPSHPGLAHYIIHTYDVPALAKEGPVNADQVKRLTRAGMGTCQGRRCREQIQMLLAMSAQVPPEQIPLASYRAPVRPLTGGVRVPGRTARRADSRPG